jgi:hypothetical protein
MFATRYPKNHRRALSARPAHASAEEPTTTHRDPRRWPGRINTVVGAASASSGKMSAVSAAMTGSSD